MALIFFIILALWCQRWLLLENEAAHFIDEAYNVLASLNFLRFGIYSPEASASIGYESSVSSGILTTWPSAVGWLARGDLFGARTAYMLWNLVLALCLGFLAGRRLTPWRGISLLIFGLASYLGLLLCIPYTDALSTQILGELGGALLLGIALTQIFIRPDLCAFLLGCVVWHTKFIYLPFALVAIIAQATDNPRRDWFKRLLGGIGLLLAPLLLWWFIICSTSGFSGFWKYLLIQVQIFFAFLFGYSGMNPEFKTTVVRGLFNRLGSPELEWFFYPSSTRFKILFFTFIPIVLLALRFLKTVRAPSGKRMRQSVLAIGMLLALAAMAYWYFFLHHKMWIRHYSGSLMVGYGVCLYFLLQALVYFKKHSIRIYSATILALLTLVIAKEISRIPTWLQVSKNPQYASRYSKFCKNEHPWTMTNQAFLDLCVYTRPPLNNSPKM